MNSDPSNIHYESKESLVKEIHVRWYKSDRRIYDKCVLIEIMILAMLQVK